MARILLFLGLIGIAPLAGAQEDNVGSGRALVFDGTSHVDLGDRYDDLQLPVTISAWVNLSSSVTDWAPVFVSQDNSNLYNGIWLIVQPDLVGVGYGDGMGENNPMYRRSKTAFVPDISERWVHITGVIRDKVDMDIYVNGQNVGGSYSGSSDFPISAVDADVARIGRWHSNGMTFHFKGIMDEVRLWDRALSQSEIRQYMCRKLDGTQPGLIGNWTFNETTGTVIRDKSANGYDGTLLGVTRSWSGAPIGDNSVYTYTGSWGSVHISAEVGADSVAVTNISGNPAGIHLYSVLDPPTQNIGLPDQCTIDHYFGVFSDATHAGAAYELRYYVTSGGGGDISVYGRTDNSDADWTEVSADNVDPGSHLSSGHSYRGEFIRTTGLALQLELGDLVIACENETVILDAGAFDPGTSVMWNTGATTQTLAVTSPGTYSVVVQTACDEATDQVTVDFLSSPPPFALESSLDFLCPDGDVTLTPAEDLSTYSVSWSNGTTSPSLTITEPGTYTLKASNICGEAEGSIEIEQLPPPPTFVLQFDTEYLCPGEEVTLTPSEDLSTYSRKWSNGSTSPAITVDEPGTYTLMASNMCGETGSSVEIKRLLPPPTFTVRPDSEYLCPAGSVTLTPSENLSTYALSWSDGSTSPSLTVNVSGTYALTASNACGEAKSWVDIESLPPPPQFGLLPSSDNLCLIDEITLTPSEDLSVYTLNWSDGSTSPTLTVSEPGTYFLTAANICGEVKASIDIGYRLLENLFVPNLITPGTDDYNQYFMLPESNDKVALTIYNRWGMMLFHSSDYENDWDGAGLPSGVYYYHASSGCLGELKGSLTLLRQ